MAIHSTKRGPLNDTERYILINALQVAATTYEQDAAIDDMPEHLSNQFLNQAKTAKAWAELLEECEEIVIR